MVDCGSHDESAQLDSEFSGVTMLRLPRYFGRTKALNIGTRTAAGEYLFFMTPEVEVLPTTIPSLVASLESDPETVAVCPLLVDTKAELAEQFFRLPTPDTGLDLMPVTVDKTAEVFPVELATFQAFLVRKFFVKGMNYLDERYGDSWSDAELCYQIRRVSRKTLALPQVTALYHSRVALRRIGPAPSWRPTACMARRYISASTTALLSGILFRIKAILKALFTLRIPLFVALISGTKIDGSQSTFCKVESVLPEDRVPKVPSAYRRYRIGMQIDALLWILLPVFIAAGSALLVLLHHAGPHGSSYCQGAGGAG